MSVATASAADDAIELQTNKRLGSLTIIPRSDVTIRSRIELQRNERGTWTTAPVTIEAISACGNPPIVPDCLELETAHPLATAPWSGRLCNSQCLGMCSNPSLSSGTYRFVVSTCDGAAKFISPNFVIPSGVVPPNPRLRQWPPPAPPDHPP